MEQQQEPQSQPSTAPAAPPAAAAALPASPIAQRLHCFTEQAPDAAIHFQVLDLGQQLYVWVAVGGARLQNMYLAIQGRHDAAMPSVATLLPDATSSSTASLAQRLARRVGRPVVCSCNLPPNNEMLQAIAERRLMRELQALGFIQGSSSSQGARPEGGAQQQHATAAGGAAGGV